MIRLDRQQFFDTANRIPYRYRHQEFLYSLVRWLKPMIVVEVGTHIGATAVWLARALQENGEGMLYCIDPFCWPAEHQQEKNWHQNIERCDVMDHVTLINGRSEEVGWPDRVDFAYIDGNHSSEVCRYDFDKSVARGATCIAFNDHAQYLGVRKVTDALRSTKDINDWADVFESPYDCGLFVLMRRQHIPEPRDPDCDPWDRSSIK